MFRLLLFLFLGVFSGCGYHLKGGGAKTLDIPYVGGDSDGMLTNALIYAFSSDSAFTYQSNGRYTLQASVVGVDNATIGYRFDRQRDLSLKENLMASEGRKSMEVEFSILDTLTKEVVWGPKRVEASSEYDYVDPNSLQDLSFINPAGTRSTVLRFSLGQLESIDSAQDAATKPLYRFLAQKMVDVISSEW